MTYEELKEKNKKLELRANICHARQRKNEQDYKRQNAPFAALKNQRITITLRVTEETRKRLMPKELKLKKWRLGNVYTVTGCFHEWYINESDGVLYPCFFRSPEYSHYDEIVEMKIADEQYEGSCEQCRLHRDGLCFLAGGMDISKKCATGEAGAFTCPAYEEKLELWSKDGSKHYPNVTYLRNAEEPRYRIYSLNWCTYSQYNTNEIKLLYSFNPVEQDNESNK